MKLKVVFMLLSVLAACDECRYADCPTQYDDIQFSFVSKSGHDLLNGDSKKYEIKDLAVFAFNDQGAKVYSPLSLENKKGANSVVAVVLASDHQSFLEVGKTVTDTLRFEFRPHPSECCGTYAELTKIFLNNRLICIDNSQFEIKER